MRDAGERVGRRTGRPARVDADGSVVRGRRQGLERAMGNLGLPGSGLGLAIVRDVALAHDGSVFTRAPRRPRRRSGSPSPPPGSCRTRVPAPAP